MTLKKKITEDRKLRIKLNQAISMHIAAKYQAQGLPVPVPYLDNHQFYYHDQRIQKYVNYLREGFEILAQVLDEQNKVPEIIDGPKVTTIQGC